MMGLLILDIALLAFCLWLWRDNNTLPDCSSAGFWQSEYEKEWP